MQGLYKESGSTVKITELPPGKWTQDYKEYLDSLVERGRITSYDNHSTEDSPDFLVRGYKGTDPLKELGLTKAVHTSNMWLTTPNGMKKYSTAEEIIVDYFKFRLEHYKQRKANLLKEYKAHAAVAENKARFVKLVVEDDIVIFKRKRANIEEQIDAHKLIKVNKSWDYLFNIKTQDYTEESIAKLNKEAAERKKMYDDLEATSIKDMWLSDLSDIQVK
jgi:DNA topoisomerase-2